jgi:hypothetical protein
MLAIYRFFLYNNKWYKLIIIREIAHGFKIKFTYR